MQMYVDQLEKVMGDHRASDANHGAAAATPFDLVPGAYTDELSTNDVAVFIDPIDGTKAFSEGDLEHVTNMIGITVGGRPLVGIIHKPFTEKRRNSSRTYVGSIESGLFYFDHSKVDRTTSAPTYIAPFETKQAAENMKGGHYQPHMCFGTDTE